MITNKMIQKTRTYNITKKQLSRLLGFVKKQPNLNFTSFSINKKILANRITGMKKELESSISSLTNKINKNENGNMISWEIEDDKIFYNFKREVFDLFYLLDGLSNGKGIEEIYEEPVNLDYIIHESLWINSFLEDVIIGVLTDQIIEIIKTVKNKQKSIDFPSLFNTIEKFYRDKYSQGFSYNLDGLDTKLFFKDLEHFITFTLLNSSRGNHPNLIERFDGFRLVKSHYANKNREDALFDFKIKLDDYFRPLTSDYTVDENDSTKDELTIGISTFFLDKYSDYLNIHLLSIFLEKINIENKKNSDLFKTISSLLEFRGTNELTKKRILDTIQKELSLQLTGIEIEKKTFNNILDILSSNALLSKSLFFHSNNLELFTNSELIKCFIMLFDQAKESFSSLILNAGEINTEDKYIAFKRLIRDLPNCSDFVSNLVNDLSATYNDSGDGETLLAPQFSNFYTSETFIKSCDKIYEYRKR